ncbi:MAG: hypothetical protein JO317_03400 [Verrucomicrobiae bacterium]|nr:hypothetical protein [Verrucomicrobiae bacterium]
MNRTARTALAICALFALLTAVLQNHHHSDADSDGPDACAACKFQQSGGASPEMRVIAPAALIAPCEIALIEAQTPRDPAVPATAAPSRAPPSSSR